MAQGMASLQAFDGRLADTAALMAESGALADSMKSGAPTPPPFMTSASRVDAAMPSLSGT